MQAFKILLFISFIGFINFLKSCTLPFVVGFFIFFLSLVFWHLSVNRARNFWSLFRYAVLFGLGFALIFVAKAATVSVIGQSLTMQSTFYTRLGGLIIMLLGLAMLPYDFSKKLNLKKWSGWSALIGGGTFALSWQPCSKFVIPAIQQFLSTEKTLAAGILFLGLVAVGIVLPLIILSLPVALILKKINFSSGVLRLMQTVGGFLLALIGLLFLTGQISIFFGLIGDIQQSLLK